MNLAMFYVCSQSFYFGEFIFLGEISIRRPLVECLAFFRSKMATKMTVAFSKIVIPSHLLKFKIANYLQGLNHLNVNAPMFYLIFVIIILFIECCLLEHSEKNNYHAQVFPLFICLFFYFDLKNVVKHTAILSILYIFMKAIFPGPDTVPPNGDVDLSYDPIWEIWLAEVNKFYQHYDRITNHTRDDTNHNHNHGPLQRRHNKRDGVLNHQPHHCLLTV